MDNPNDIAARIEALLFVSGESVASSRLVRILELDKKSFEEGIVALRASLTGHGIQLMEHEDSFALVTGNTVSESVTAFLKHELESGLSKASLETLTIILYKGPIHRAAIDYIRGVNSTYTLQTLLLRGLIERVADPKDARVFLYKPTDAFLKFAGLTALTDLPNYEPLRALKEHEVTEALANTETKAQSDAPPTITPTP